MMLSLGHCLGGGDADVVVVVRLLLWLVVVTMWLSLWQCCCHCDDVVSL